MVLTQNLGKTLGVGVGDGLRLQTPHGPRQAAVLALVPYFSTVIGTVGMDLDHLRAWFDRPAATTLQIFAAPAQIARDCWQMSAASCPHPTTFTTAVSRFPASRRRCTRACSSPTRYG
ncbi:efflux ABC transporter, permease domain protein [Mycobacterium xenopi 4042]|uniref:Efflux ABC transporter, permease domain protein n=1 Tax=Mycobacterium xenopi 4042 TaxID=1299334 RepID=X7YKE0_MYCXE|nr:efflux ABC transporter, permease domain protein [Mycobacterium xenopi 4042]